MRLLLILLLLAGTLSARVNTDGTIFNPTQRELSESIDDIEYQEKAFMEKWNKAIATGMRDKETLNTAYGLAVYPIQRAWIIWYIVDDLLRTKPTKEHSEEIDRRLREAFLYMAEGDGFDHGAVDESTMLQLLTDQWGQAKRYRESLTRGPQ